MSICWTHLVETLQYSKGATIVSYSSKLIFISVHTSLIVIPNLLIEMVFISWCDSYSWLSRTWIVFHVSVTTAEMYHPQPHFPNIYCLFSINDGQVSMDVNRCNYSSCRNSITYLCQLSFCQTAPLREYWWEYSTSIAIPPTFASDFVGQYNKIGDIPFGAFIHNLRVKKQFPFTWYISA